MKTVYEPNALIFNKETCRDFCGSFYKFLEQKRKTNSDDISLRNKALICVIPEATKKALTDNMDWFCIENEEQLREYFATTLTDAIVGIEENFNHIVSDVLFGRVNVDDIDEETIAKICDFYYIDWISAKVEREAIELIR